jgi:hypothetical protein
MNEAQHQDTAAAAPDDQAGSADEDLIERIGAEIDRRLDARLAALDLAGTAATGWPPRLPADPASGTSSRPGRRAGWSRSPRQSLWLGILIGSGVSGIAAVVQGVRISSEATEQISGGPENFVNASGVILSALIGVWLLLFVVYCFQVAAGLARDRKR